MDLGTLLGTIFALLVFIFGIIFDPSKGIDLGPLRYFIHIPSLIIVGLGTVAATLASYPLDTFMRMGKIIGSAWQAKPNTLIETLTMIVDVSKIARKNILAVEDALPSIENEFLRNGLRLVVDRIDRDLIVEMLMAEMKYLDKRQEYDANVMKLMSQLSPAFGMIGTLIGLVILLQNLDDPSKIGPAMAVALITTLYGSVFSNVLFLPWYNKLILAKDEDLILHEMIRDGILFIEKNERPDFIEQDLMNYLSPALKKTYEELKFDTSKGNR